MPQGVWGHTYSVTWGAVPYYIGIAEYRRRLWLQRVLSAVWAKHMACDLRRKPMRNITVNNITDAVVKSLGDDVPARNREIMASALKHMHDVC